MTPAEQDALDRELRDIRKRLDRAEALIEKLARDDVPPKMPTWPDYQSLGMITDPLGR